MPKNISIIIPNYNGKHLLKQYLPSVFLAVKNAGLPYEIIVVDDCSTDDTIVFLQQTYPTIILLVNPANKGFSYSCNQGIAIAQNDVILLLNSDVELSPHYFNQQLQYFDYNDTFGVMGRIMSADRQKIEDAARLLSFKGSRLKVNQFYYSANPTDKTVYTAYLSGANALVCAKKLKELGGFNEIYSPFSGEDVDLSLRAWQLNWKCYYEHQSVCYHKVSASTKTQIKSNFIKQVYYRNRIVLLSIHLNGFRAKVYPLAQFFCELIPKMLLLKFWFLESYLQYLSLTSEIEKSRADLVQLKLRYNSTVTLSNVMATINTSVSQKSIIKV